MGSSQVTVSASTFVDSLGVNTHGGHNVDGYKNSSLIIKSLNYLGIDNVREALAADGKAQPIVSAMADAGIKFDFIVPTSLPSAGAGGLAGFIESLKAFQAEHPGSILSIEGLNEANITSFSYNGSSSLDAAAAYQRDLYTAVKADAALKGIAVINLSLGMDDASDHAALGDLGKYSDYANAHAYAHTGGNADASMQYTMDLAKLTSKGDPIVVTETGYTTLESHNGIGVSVLAQAKLTLNNLLFAYENGSQKTYLYNLFDMSTRAELSEKEGHFGLFYQDGSPKLAAEAIHNFTTILTYGDTGASGGSAFGYTLGNAPAQTHTMVMQKSGGVVDLVIWNEKVVWNDTTDKDIVTNPVDVTVTLDKVEALVYVYDPLLGTDPIAVYRNVQSFKVPLSDHALIVEIGAKGPVQDPIKTVAANLTMTADAFVTQMDTLADSAGLQSITLKGSHVLEVSSVETMAYVIANYDHVLSKIAGGYSFSVTYGQGNWRLTQTFDEKGAMQTQTDYALVNGKISTITEVSSDGSREYQYFDSLGRLTREIDVSPEGNRTSLNYDAATLKLTDKTVSGVNGSYLTEIYKNGVLSRVYDKQADGSQINTAYGILGKTFATEIQRLDLTGKVVEVIRKHTDGTLDYRQVTGKDGSKETFSYDGKGKLLSDVTAAADGTVTTLAYDVTTAKMIKMTVVSNGNTTVTLYTNGIKSSIETVLKSGQKESQTFDATGNLVGATVKTADGGFVTKIYKNGVLDRTYDKSADGSQINSLFGITGKTYVTESQRVDASGKVVEVIRKHADGTLDYRQVIGKDGSRETLIYDGKGKLVNDVMVAADGTLTTLVYDAATAKILKMTVVKSGDTAITSYINGIKSNVETILKTGQKESQTFDTTGAVASGTVKTAEGSFVTKIYKSGVLSASYEKNADGSQLNTVYGVTGKTYVTESQRVDAAGNIVEVIRKHADGTLDYRQLIGGDGSKETLSYDSKGKLVSDVTATADGTLTTLLYDTTTAKLVKMTVAKNGDTSLTSYVNGVKSSIETALKSGEKTTQTFDTATGKVASENIKEIDGGYVTKIYKSGVLSAVYDKNADGSQVNTVYGLTGRTYVSETQKLDKSGNVVEVVRTHADGTLDYRQVIGSNGSKETLTYDSRGKLLSDVTAAADGTLTTLLYDAATAKLTKMAVVTGDSTIVTSYASGIKSSIDTVLKSGEKTTQTFDTTTGKIAAENIQSTNGDFSTKTYKNGILDRHYEKHADGSQINTSYGVTGKTFVTEKQVLDTKGQIVSIERLHSDGSFDYKEERYSNGSKDVSVYDSKGAITSHIALAADKSQVVDTYLSGGDIRTERYSATSSLLSIDLQKNGDHTVNLYADNQVIHGGAGNDTINFRNTVKGDFVYDGGHDTLNSFNLVAGAADQVVLDKHWAGSFADLHMSQNGADVVISFDSHNSVTVQGVSIGSLNADYFIFS